MNFLHLKRINYFLFCSSSFFQIRFHLDGNLTQISGHHSQVHYLFNNLISNLTEHPFDTSLLNTWKTLYEVSYKNNLSTNFHSLNKQFSPLFYSNLPNQKYVFLLTLSIFILIMINFCLCIIFARRGHGCRKREYNCLNNHKQLNVINQSEQHHGGSSPSSTNSNGTITIDSTQQLIVHTNSHEQEHQSSPLSSLLCTTNSSINSTPPVDIIHPINITKKNGILKCSTIKKSNVLVSSSLPEAIV